MNEREWDEVAATFEEEIFSVINNDRLGLIAERVKRFGAKNASAIDIGCGIGRALPLLATHFGRVHACDISSECLEVAQRQNAFHHTIRYDQVDLTRPEAQLPKVDLVLCINVLLNASLGQREVMLDNVRRAVRPGGHLLLTTPALESALFASYRLVRWNQAKGMSPAHAQRRAARAASRFDLGIVKIDGVPTKHFLKEELEEEFREAGFTVEEILKVEYPWTAVFPEAPAWMGDPLPWNWLIVARAPVA